MSTYSPKSALPEVKNARVAIITAEWNNHITSRLEEGALSTLRSNGFADDNIDTYSVPGTVELTFAARRVIDNTNVDAVIVFGVVIRGDTPHFDYVCQSVTQGVTQLNATGSVPVIFGVLTLDNEQQAYDRIGGAAGHKGIEAAETAIKMIDFRNHTALWSVQ